MALGRHVLLALIIAFSFTIRIWGLWGLDLCFFDEGHYASTTRAVYEDWTFLFSSTKYGWSMYPVGALSAMIFGEGEFSYRMVSVASGTLSVLVFFLVTKAIAGHERAILSAAMLGCLPIHAAISKAYYLEPIALLFCLSSMFFYVRSFKSGGLHNMAATAAFAAVAFAAKSYYALLPLFALMAWLLLDKGASGGSFGDRLSLSAFHVASVILGIVAFYLLLYAAQASFAGQPFDGPSMQKQLDGGQIRVTRRYGNVGAPIDLLSNLVKIKYRDFGKLPMWLAFSPLQLAFMALGLALSTRRLGEGGAGLELLAVLALLSYIPVQLGQYRHAQYLAMLSPAASWLMGIALFEIRRKKGEMAAIAVAALLFAYVFALMLSPYNPAYQTHFSSISAYVNEHSSEGENMIYGSFAMRYYGVRGIMMPKNAIRPWLVLKIENVRFVQLDDGPYDYMRERNKIWIRANCMQIDRKAGIPPTSSVHLFDCGKR